MMYAFQLCVYLYIFEPLMKMPWVTPFLAQCTDILMTLQSLANGVCVIKEWLFLKWFYFCLSYNIHYIAKSVDTWTLHPYLIGEHVISCPILLEDFPQDFGSWLQDFGSWLAPVQRISEFGPRLWVGRPGQVVPHQEKHWNRKGPSLD